MPPEVRRAKHIRYLMSDRAEIGDAEDAEAIASETLDESTDEPNDTDDSPQLDSAPYVLSLLDKSPDSDWTAPAVPEHVLRMPQIQSKEVTAIQPANETGPTPNPISPRPLARHPRANSNDAGRGKDIMSLMKVFMVQD